VGRIARNLINVPVVVILVALLSGCSNVILRDVVGYSVLDPKISVEQGGAPVASYDFGPVPSLTPVSIHFSIYNQGKGYLNLTGTTPVVISGTDPGVFFSVTQQPSSLTDIEPGQRVEFVIRFPVTAAIGDKSAQATITSDDPNNGSYVLTLTGTVC
jgi:hypothetical protein